MKWLWIVLIFVISCLILYLLPHKSLPISKHSTHTTAKVTSSEPVNTLTKSIFVPYWSISSQLSQTSYDSYIYFGISASNTGIATTDDGYKKIATFLSLVPEGHKKLLAVSMVDQNVNEEVLHDNALSKIITSQAVDIAQKNGFDGIVLDLEYSALSFDSVTQSVTSFSANFAKEAEAHNLSFYQAIPGDSVYRVKPYNLTALGQAADGIFVMAYDFHKAKGNPGPNFPFKRLEDEDYDFQTMTTDFLKNIPASKMTVVFGMFGYDWQVDSKNRSTAPATSLSDSQIQQEFSDTCLFYGCKTKRDPLTHETEISYTDSSGNTHIVWFEDSDSAGVKAEYLKQMGIGSISFWAYGYF